MPTRWSSSAAVAGLALAGLVAAASLVVGAPPATATENSWAKGGTKYARLWVRMVDEPTTANWTHRRVTRIETSGSLGGSADISHWYRTYRAIGIRYQAASSTNWNATDDTRGASKTNFNCSSTGAGCSWEVWDRDSSWQYSYDSSYLISTVSNRIVCDADSSCADWTETTTIRLYSPLWK